MCVCRKGLSQENKPFAHKTATFPTILSTHAINLPIRCRSSMWLVPLLQHKIDFCRWYIKSTVSNTRYLPNMRFFLQQNQEHWQFKCMSYRNIGHLMNTFRINCVSHWFWPLADHNKFIVSNAKFLSIIWFCVHIRLINFDCLYFIVFISSWWEYDTNELVHCVKHWISAKTLRLVMHSNDYINSIFLLSKDKRSGAPWKSRYRRVSKLCWWGMSFKQFESFVEQKQSDNNVFDFEYPLSSRNKLWKRLINMLIMFLYQWHKINSNQKPYTMSMK